MKKFKKTLIERFQSLWLSSFLLSIFWYFMSCSNSPDPLETLLQADRDFAKMGSSIGLKEAFLYYAAPEAILLRNGSKPIQGKESLGSFLEPMNGGFKLEWEPESGTIASSEDLGYTMGNFVLRDSSNKLLSKGSYLSIWKKDPVGEWKWVVDVGINH
ncbi:hypothetical protein [Algoriphagus sp. CAU 1675]|uniref:YybH family protein n=1 Tax=Algoriphagus sp. CAU 1675 TaxID=3032597 RepID=UPI0023DC80B0|nr:hypothetical protein [Algoriphagus sp. CAU 1675]MDF2157041.1 hypothetical protein [Algoriphagus sp. CAU 1675]